MITQKAKIPEFTGITPITAKVYKRWIFYLLFIDKTLN